MAGVKEILAGYAAEVEEKLASCLEGKDIPEGLRSAMSYSLMAGGKRLRPVLCLSWAEMLGLERAGIMGFAAGLELIHTYSLVHDDLPAMDDDDLRRGKPSNHKKFGEAAAILAGDGLLTEAFSMMLETEAEPVRVLAAVREVARGAGPSGMVGGQALDMEYTANSGVSLEQLRGMHARKTGALIRAACVSGAILAGDRSDAESAALYARHVGAAFQIVDDILDVVGDEDLIGKPVGSDEGKSKTTYPGLLGLEESKRLAEAEIQEALASISRYSGPRADFLADLARYIVERAN